jgi:hypothetical protein
MSGNLDSNAIDHPKCSLGQLTDDSLYTRDTAFAMAKLALFDGSLAGVVTWANQHSNLRSYL